MTNKQIKSLALVKLKGNWGNCISISLAFFTMLLLFFLGVCIAYLVYRAIPFYPILSYSEWGNLPHTVFTGIACFAYVGVLIMISYTILRLFIDISRGRFYNTSRNRIMCYKRLFFKISVVPHITRTVIILLCTVPGFLAADAVRSLFSFSSEAGSLTLFVLMFFMMSILVIILSIVLTINAVICLHLLPTILMLNPLMPLTHAISLCFRKAEGNKMKIVSFHLSFVKYIPLFILIYPAVVIFPYYLMSDLILVEDILGKELTTDNFLEVFAEKNNEETFAKG